jgi:hypothetical protein
VSSFPRTLLPRALGILVVPLIVVLSIGASDAPDDARVRLQNMSLQQRSELAEALKQFDLKLTPDQQKSIREIDEQISRLSAENRVHYLAAMRRYHDWLDSLPENVRDKLQDKPPGERMAQIKTMISRYPLPMDSTPDWMQFADVAGLSPLELATTFKIWQELTSQERRELEGLPTGQERRLKLNEHGRLRKLWEIRPADFHVQDWIPKAEARVEAIRTVDPGLKGALTKAETRAEAKAEALAKNKRKNEGKEPAHAPSLFLRRLAINLYFLEQPPPRPVDPQRLAQFFAAMPPWVRGSFDSYTADEARRRLTLAYRLLFPNDEFKPARPGAPKSLPGGSAASESSPSPPPPVPVAPRKETTAPKAPAAPSSSPF